MSAATLNNEGRQDQLDTMLSLLAASLKVQLVTSPTPNDRTKVLANYGICNFSGYADVTPTWGASSLDGNGNAKAVGSTCTFTHNGGGTSNTVVGYIVKDNGTGKVWFSDLFTAPVLMSSNGNQITLNPVLYLGDCTTPL